LAPTQFFNCRTDGTLVTPQANEGPHGQQRSPTPAHGHSHAFRWLRRASASERQRTRLHCPLPATSGQRNRVSSVSRGRARGGFGTSDHHVTHSPGMNEQSVNQERWTHTTGGMTPPVSPVPSSRDPRSDDPSSAILHTCRRVIPGLTVPMSLLSAPLS